MIECDLFVRVIPAKGNRVIAKPYTAQMSAFGSKRLTAVTATETTPPASETVPKTMSTKSSTITSHKPLVVQTKLNDFFNKPESMRTTSRATELLNFNPTIKRASQNKNRSTENMNPVRERIPSPRIPHSNGQAQSHVEKPHKSPPLLSSRSQLYDFDESFLSTQFSMQNEQRNTDGQISLKLNKFAHQPKNISKLEHRTPITAKLFNAMENGNEFVSAKTIFTSDNGIGILIEENSDESFESSYGLTQNELFKPKNIVACTESVENVLPKHNQCLEQSISKILDCKVTTFNSSRKYRNQFVNEAMTSKELALLKINKQPLMGSWNDINGKQATRSQSHGMPKSTSKPIQCDLVFANDSAEWPFSPIPAITSPAVDSPMLERKKHKRDHLFDSNFNDIGDDNVPKIPNDETPLSMPPKFFDGHLAEGIHLAVDDEWGNSFESASDENRLMDHLFSAPKENVECETRRDSMNFESRWSNEESPNKSPERQALPIDELIGREKRRDPMNFDSRWSNEESPNKSTERKALTIDELIANRCGRDKGDANNQMKKPNGKMVQARVKRTNQSKIFTEALNRSWNTCVDQYHSKEDRNREYVRRHILRLPQENRTAPPKRQTITATTDLFDWFSD